MQGRIWVESELGAGSRFHFTAWLGRPRPSASAMAGSAARVPAAAKANRTLRLLLAEDNLVNQKIACRVLEKQGHHVTVAADGRQAIAALAREPFDVVLMDVQMPEMDGFEATAAIRAAEQGTGRHLPIIAMTAHAMQRDRERCLAAGMDDYISKPLNTPLLLEMLQRFALAIDAAQEAS